MAGLTRYVGDLALPGMLHAALATSKVASATIASIDTTAAAAMPDVVAVLTARDIPGPNLVGVIFADQPLLVTDRVRMVGDRFALVAARNPEAAWAAAHAVRAELRPLPGVHDPLAAMAPGSPKVHESGNLFHTFRVIRGDIDKARRAASVVVEAEYHVGGQEHAYLEPQGCLAIPEGQRITIVASCQCPFY
ncbi:MAG TPA: molybdopterin-dependent oxidoreductase, partial [Thermoanaerobaculaceae bacterium]|nr:molybdopterin-dependent oxidoreductase [Thermoanaerobaculaceae bacterium]